MSKNANYTKPNTTRENRTGVDPEEREELLLDDLQHEVSRLADAVERQNELLNESTSEADVE
jgi:Mg2+ and Co2+ transporter CorA